MRILGTFDEIFEILIIKMLLNIKNIKDIFQLSITLLQGFVVFRDVINPFGEAAAECVLGKMMFLKISQNSQENACARVLRPATLLKNNSGTGDFL